MHHPSQLSCVCLSRGVCAVLVLRYTGNEHEHGRWGTWDWQQVDTIACERKGEKEGMIESLVEGWLLI